MRFGLENMEVMPEIETVRVALYHRGKFLMLQKSDDSPNPAGLEFPGGQIDEDETKGVRSTLQEQEHAAVREMQEETEIDIDSLPRKKVDEFAVYFETLKPNGKRKKHRRVVHLFLVVSPDEPEITPVVGSHWTDKHIDYRWMTPEELIGGVLTLEENPATGKKTYPVTRNSRHIKKLLEAVGYRKA